MRRSASDTGSPGLRFGYRDAGTACADATAAAATARRRTRRRRAVSGFTLIEALVALAVVAVVLAALGSLVATTVRNIRGLDPRLALVETARMVEAGLPDRLALDVGTLAGERAGYRWRVDVAPVADQGPQPTSLFASDRRPPPPPWVPLHVVIRVQAPAGQVLRLDTVRLRASSAR